MERAIKEQKEENHMDQHQGASLNGHEAKEHFDEKDHKEPEEIL